MMRDTFWGGVTVSIQKSLLPFFLIECGWRGCVVWKKKRKPPSHFDLLYLFFFQFILLFLLLLTLTFLDPSLCQPAAHPPSMPWWPQPTTDVRSTCGSCPWLTIPIDVFCSASSTVDWPTRPRSRSVAIQKERTRRTSSPSEPRSSHAPTVRSLWSRMER